MKALITLQDSTQFTIQFSTYMGTQPGNTLNVNNFYPWLKQHLKSGTGISLVPNDNLKTFTVTLAGSALAKATNADVDAEIDDTKYITTAKVFRAIARKVKAASTSVAGIVTLARNQDVDATETDTTRIPNVASVKRLVLRLVAVARIPSANPGNNKVWKTSGSGVPGWRDDATGTGEANVQADWAEGDTNSHAYIKNKPTIPTVPTRASNADVDAEADDFDYMTVAKTFRAIARKVKAASTSVAGIVTLARNQDVDATETDTSRVITVATAKRLVARLIPSTVLARIPSANPGNSKVWKTSSTGVPGWRDDATGSAGSGEDNVQVDWNEADTESDAFIKNKPTIPEASDAAPEQPNNNAGAPGTGSDFSREDHKHPLPALATRSSGGLMSRGDKQQTDKVTSIEHQVADLLATPHDSWGNLPNPNAAAFRMVGINQADSLASAAWGHSHQALLANTNYVVEMRIPVADQLAQYRLTVDGVLIEPTVWSEGEPSTTYRFFGGVGTIQVTRNKTVRMQRSTRTWHTTYGGDLTEAAKKRLNLAEDTPQRGPHIPVPLPEGAQFWLTEDDVLPETLSDHLFTTVSASLIQDRNDGGADGRQPFRIAYGGTALAGALYNNSPAIGTITSIFKATGVRALYSIALISGPLPTAWRTGKYTGRYFIAVATGLVTKADVDAGKLKLRIWADETGGVNFEETLEQISDSGGVKLLATSGDVDGAFFAIWEDSLTQHFGLRHTDDGWLHSDLSFDSGTVISKGLYEGAADGTWARRYFLDKPAGDLAGLAGRSAILNVPSTATEIRLGIENTGQTPNNIRPDGALGTGGTATVFYIDYRDLAGKTIIIGAGAADFNVQLAELANIVVAGARDDFAAANEFVIQNNKGDGDITFLRPGGIADIRPTAAEGGATVKPGYAALISLWAHSATRYALSVNSFKPTAEAVAIHRGAYADNTAYSVGEIVVYNGELYYVVRAVGAANTDKPDANSAFDHLTVNARTDGEIKTIADRSALSRYPEAEKAKVQRLGVVQAPAYAAALTPNVNNGGVIDVTLTGNVTFGLSGGANGSVALARLTQDGTGSRTLALAASITRKGPAAPVLTTDANALDILMFQRVGATWRYVGIMKNV